jgi:hypothetical protein
MSYSKKQIIELEREINKNKPLLASPTSRLIKQCKGSGVRIKRNQQLQIDRVAYVKDKIDIFCIFHISEAKKSIFTSIVNLTFIGEGRLFEKIKEFQAWDGVLD